MSGRGRGRGGRGGANKSFNKEQLSALGVGGGELTPGPVTQPPPLYPPLERKPVPLVPSMELDYLLLLRQEFIEHMQLSPAYLKMRDGRIQSDKTIDKLVAQLPSAKEKFDWKLLPHELRPKLVPGRLRKKVDKQVDINQRLNQLEKLEDTTRKPEVVVKKEAEEDKDEETEMVEEDEDEEMDDGTDYANNYFDNGESYEDDDDNLDDGPIY